MQAMVVDAFQQVDDLVALKARALNVVEESFKVVDGLQEGSNEGERNGEAKAPFDNKCQDWSTKGLPLWIVIMNKTTIFNIFLKSRV